MSKLIQGSKRDGITRSKNGTLNCGNNRFGRKVLAKVAIIVTSPTFPKIIKVDAMRRLWGLLTTSSASLVVKPVPEKQDIDWNFAKDHSNPVSSKAIAPILTTIKEATTITINNIKFMRTSLFYLANILNPLFSSKMKQHPKSDNSHKAQQCKIEEGKMKELHLIIKADVQGSVEVLSDTLPNLSTDNIKINIIHSATGNITESDILLASASNAIVIGYNIKPNQNILDFSKEEKVEIRSYNVIYQLIEDIKKAMVGMLEPVVKETYLGRAEIKRLFRIPHVGIIAGCLVTDGKITRNSEVRLIRENEVIHQDKISSLKHIKNNVTEVKKDYECGIRLANYKDIQEGDIIESFIKEKVRPE